MDKACHATLFLRWKALPAAFVAALALFAPAQAPAQSGERTVAVEAVIVTPAPLVESVSSVGNLVADESVVIRPEVDGRIVEIGFQEGQPVKAGQLLFRLDAAAVSYTHLTLPTN